MKKLWSALLALVVFGQAAVAEPSGFNATIRLSYDPNLVVTLDGRRLGDLMTALGVSQAASSGTAMMSTASDMRLPRIPVQAIQ